MIYSTYAKVLPRVGGYLTERGSLEVKRFETFLSLLAEHERENFENEMADQKFMKGKRNQMIEKYGDGTISSTDIRERRKKSKKLEELENLAKQQEADCTVQAKTAKTAGSCLCCSSKRQRKQHQAD